MPATGSGPENRPSRRPWTALALALVVLVALAARLPALEADPPLEVEETNAPLLDAYWYLVQPMRLAGLGVAAAERAPAPYDRPLHTALAAPVLAATGARSWAPALVGVVPGVLSVLVAFEAVRRAAGLRRALLAGLLLATSWPYVALNRTPLVYNGLAFCLVAGLAAETLRRGVAGRALALGLALAGAFALKVHGLVLVGGIAASWALEAERPKRPGDLVRLSIGLSVPMLVLALLARIFPDEVRDNAHRILRYLAPDLSPLALVRRAFDLPLEIAVPRLAPGLVAAAVAAPGLALADPPRGRRDRRLLATATGWLVAVGVGAVLLDYRPHRYLEVAYPPLAILAAFSVTRALELRPRPARRSASQAAALAASAFLSTNAALGAAAQILETWDSAPSLQAALGGVPLRLAAALTAAAVAWIVSRSRGATSATPGRPPGPGRGLVVGALAALLADVVLASASALLVRADASLPVAHALAARELRWGVAGGIGTVAGVLAARDATARLARISSLALASLALLGSVGYDATRLVAYYRGASRSVLEARDAVAAVLGPRAVLAGPYAPMLGFGNRVAWRWNLAPDLTVDDAHVVERLREIGVTHLALDPQHAANYGPRLFDPKHGLARDLVARVYVRRQLVLIHRFEWARPPAYEPSPFELAADAERDGELDRSRDLFAAASAGGSGIAFEALARTASATGHLDLAARASAEAVARTPWSASAWLRRFEALTLSGVSGAEGGEALARAARLSPSVLSTERLRGIDLDVTRGPREPAPGR